MSPALPATSLCLGQKLPAMAPRQPAAASLSMVDIRVEVNEGEPIESALRRFKVKSLFPRLHALFFACARSLVRPDSCIRGGGGGEKGEKGMEWREGTGGVGSAKEG
eukprot:1286307-Rhodomonas_salina.1